MAYYTVTYDKKPQDVKNVSKNLVMLELLKGLSLTFKYMFHKPITMRYPEQKWFMPERLRAQVALVRDRKKPDEDICVGCCMCERICPSKALEVVTDQGPDGSKIVLEHKINMVRCVYCGLCVEICPVNAIVHTDNYETARYTREDMILDKKELLRTGKIWKRRVRYMKKKGAEHSSVVNLETPKWTFKKPDVVSYQELLEKGLEYNQPLGYKSGYKEKKIPKKAMT
ncbi:MAG: NuoI/complex I 23 kDa subunit family protein [bacterium]